MSAGRYDVTLKRGEQYSDLLTWYADDGSLTDLTGWTASWRITDNPEAAAPLLTTVPTLGGIGGTILLLLTPLQTLALLGHTYWHALWLTSPAGAPQALVDGLIHVGDA